jgi:hypothetical protein
VREVHYAHETEDKREAAGEKKEQRAEGGAVEKQQRELPDIHRCVYPRPILVQAAALIAAWPTVSLRASNDAAGIEWLPLFST